MNRKEMAMPPVQGVDHIVIQASPQRIYQILSDGSLLPRWMPPVQYTTAGTETAGCTRECAVEMDGRSGKVVERCIEAIPNRRIAWELMDDTLGFNKMLEGFSFSFSLEPLPGGATRVLNETCYRPRNILAALMNVLLLRRKFSKVRQQALQGIKRLAEATAVYRDAWNIGATPNAQLVPLPPCRGPAEGEPSTTR